MSGFESPKRLIVRVAIPVLFLLHCAAAIAVAGDIAAAADETTRPELEELPTTGPITAAQIGSGVYWRPVLSETSITQVLADMERWQLRNLYVEAFADTRTIFPSDHFQQTKPTDRDWLQHICEEANRHHVRVFAWVHTLQWYRAADTSTTPTLLQQHQDWMERTRTGNVSAVNDPSIFVSPAAPAVKQRLLGLIDELCTRSIDGINLDDVRYNSEEEFGYNEFDVQQFRSANEIDPFEIKQDTSRGSSWMKWALYREDLLTSVVHELSFRARQRGFEQNRRVIVTASYYPGYASTRGKNTGYQNWPEWVERRYIDVSNPMCYSPSISGLEKELREVRSVHQSTAVACVPVLALGKLMGQHPAYSDQRKVLEGVGFRHVMVYNYETLRAELEQSK